MAMNNKSRNIYHKIWGNKSVKDVLFESVLYIVFSLIIVICAYPFYFLLISTISDNQMVNLNQITIIPKGIHFTNYIDVLKLERIKTSALLSVAKTLLGTSANMLISSYMAYFFSKEEVWHRKLFYRFTIITMYFSAGIIPAYMNIRNLGLMNTFWVHIVPHLFTVYNMILVKTSMEAIPASLEESAEIDGAGYMTCFFKIVLPLSKPILATVGLFSAVSQWNNVFDTKLYITNSKLYSLQFVLYEYYQQIKSIQQTMDQMGGEMASAASTMSVRLTMTAVTTLPIILVYPFIQKYYMKGIMLGAVKG